MENKIIDVRIVGCETRAVRSGISGLTIAINISLVVIFRISGFWQ